MSIALTRFVFLPGVLWVGLRDTEAADSKLAAGASPGAAVISCLPPARAKAGPWIVVKSVRGKFGGRGEQFAVLLHHQSKTGEGSAVVQDNPAILVLLDSSENCLAFREGYRKPGSLRVPHFESELQVFAIDSKQDLLMVRSTYSHGFTEESTVLLGWNGKSLKELWSGVTLSVSPSGQSSEVALVFKDLNGDGHADLQVSGAETGSGRYLWSPREFAFKR